MKYPAIMISGKAGSGKDTIASLIKKSCNGTIIALADPLKQLAKHLFDFDEKSLWGESKLRGIEQPYRLADLSAKRYSLPDKFQVLGPQIKSYVDELIWKNASQRTKQEDVKISPRKVLQDIGGSLIRDSHPGFWIKFNEKLVNEALSSGKEYNRVTGEFFKTEKTVSLVIVSDGRYRDELLNAKKSGWTLIKVVNPKENSTDTHASETEQDNVPGYWHDLVIYNNKEAGLKKLDRAVFGIIKEMTSESGCYV